MAPEEIETFRAMADGWLSEAQREARSPRIQADAAFDAAYMYCRAAMVGADEELLHPHPAALTGVTERLDWRPVVMATTIQYLKNWYFPFRSDDDPYSRLLAIAVRLQGKVNKIKTQL